MRIGERDTHPAADAFPMMEGAEYVGLVEDVRKHGQREPAAVVVADGAELIVDGRNRARACAELGVPLSTVVRDFADIDGIVSFVLSKNLHRRHLTPSQRAIVADRLAGLQKGQRSDTSGKSTMTQPEAARLLHVSARQVSTARELRESGRADLVAAVAAGKKSLTRAVRESKRDASAAKLKAKPQPLPTGPFDVVVVDPPWRYAKNGDGAEVRERRGEVDYPDMTEAEIAAVGVPALLSDDAIVWLWTTNAHMPEAVRIAAAWGLEWKTILTWTKNKLGMGDWLRGKTEHCVLLTRGKPTVTLTTQTTDLRGDVREHSRKPQNFFDLVERLCPGTKLELFARAPRKNWSVHGVDADRFKAEPVQSTMEIA